MIAGGVSVQAKTWGSLLRTLAALSLGPPRVFSLEFGFLPFPLPPVSLPTLCVESLMAALAGMSGGEAVEYLSVELASQTLFGSVLVVCGPGCSALWSEVCRPHPAPASPQGWGVGHLALTCGVLHLFL